MCLAGLTDPRLPCSGASGLFRRHSELATEDLELVLITEGRDIVDMSQYLFTLFDINTGTDSK